MRTLREYVEAGQLDVIQEKMSILDRTPQKELLPFCEAHNISLQTYSPIEQGLLSGKIANDYKVRTGEAREGKRWWTADGIRVANEMLAGWKDLTEKYNCTTTNLCICWNAMCSTQINVLCGARKRSQIEDTARSLQINLSREDFDRMLTDADAVIARLNRNSVMF